MELKGVGSTPIHTCISTLSSNSNYSSWIGVSGTLQFHPKGVEWSPNLHIHSRSGPVSANKCHFVFLLWNIGICNCVRHIIVKSTKSLSKHGTGAQMLARMMIVEFSQHDLNDCDCSTLGAVANSSGGLAAVSSYQKEKFGLNTEEKLPINTVLCVVVGR